MRRKKRKLDQFLHQRKKNQEVVLTERTQLHKRVVQFLMGTALAAILTFLVKPQSALQTLALACVFQTFLILGGLYLHAREPEVFDRPGSFNKLIALFLFALGLYQFVIFMDWSPFLVPMPMFAMILALAFPEGTVLFSLLALGLFIGLTSPRIVGGAVAGGSSSHPSGFPVDFPLMLTLMAGAFVSVLGMRRIRRQSKPVVVGFCAGALQALVILAFQLMVSHSFVLTDLWDHVRVQLLLRDPGWAFAGGLMSGALVTCLLPAVELFFDVLTERRLLDLADPSGDLLRVLRERAPGTYQHTLGVAQLASNAAEAIGGNRLLAEVGAYYHDIGKIFKPEYFVENMQENKSVHDRLRPSMSKMVIISHVKDGVDLAREAKLPEKIIDMIPMHHGTTVVEYFYQKARRQSVQDEDSPGDSEYRYPGAKPRFREAGILMLADMVEAIAKTEAEPNPGRFRTMVHDQILKRLLDGQLDESDLTLNDLRVIEESFVRTLTTVYHSRIKYPVESAEAAPGPASGRAPPAPSPAASTRLPRQAPA
jgi:putative nucleotidyltransferase with HDIG domain